MKRFNITSALIAAVTLSGMIALLAGCESRSAAPSNTPKPQAKAPTPAAPSTGNAIDKATADAKSALALLPKADLPSLDVPVPSQDELDLKAITDITDQNADAAFKDLEKDIDSDTGG